VYPAYEILILRHVKDGEMTFLVSVSGFRCSRDL
jgi:hypothetical protein